MSDLAELRRAAVNARAERPEVALALATLYAVHGSSYRQPGARLLVDAEGRVLAGAVSGGCLEGDVAAHAAGVCASGRSRLLTYDLRDDLQAIWGFGAMCDGVAHLLLEPLPDTRWLDDACAVREARQTSALLTVIEESPAGVTATLGACAGDVRVASQPLVATAHASSHGALGEIAIQSGVRRVFVDPLLAPVSLVLIGAGRGAEAFATIALTLGWQVTLIDHRALVLQSVTAPPHVRRVLARSADGIGHVSRDARTAVALLSHQFAMDAEWLKQLLPLPLGYIGVLGSRQRAAQLLDAVRADGVLITPGMERVLHAPIGLDLGGESPESIALSAVAEIEAVLHGRPGNSLRDRVSPIHLRTATPPPAQ